MTDVSVMCHLNHLVRFRLQVIILRTTSIPLLDFGFDIYNRVSLPTRLQTMKSTLMMQMCIVINIGFGNHWVLKINMRFGCEKMWNFYWDLFITYFKTMFEGTILFCYCFYLLAVVTR